MALRVAIVGPGRVGRAFGRRLAGPRVDLLGFVGRSVEAANAACQWVGVGRALALADLACAHVVVFAVGDADLEACIASAIAAVPPRQCSLWLHTSGRFGLEVFDVAQVHGVRRGALHPVAPFPDAETGARNMVGAPAVWRGDGRSARLLVRLAELLSLVPIQDQGGNRVLYHAACVLAANGLTALRSQVDTLFAAAGGFDRAAAGQLADALMANALRSSQALGPTAALSGPVVRGDAATIAAHLQALSAGAPAVRSTYVSLMLAALGMAVDRGLRPAAALAVREALSGAAPDSDPGVQPLAGD